MTAEKLGRYKAKRDFGITPEPADGGQAGADRSFVIQKHWASRLHYDFRLELDGTLVSWAVPKGPSFDPKDKRMAVHVEDHPLSYASFEGTIPEKQYGAGKVIVWDEGTWHPLGDADAGLRSGHLKFDLRGHKMRGKWALVRMKGRGGKQDPWLLIKEKDEYARPADEFSVVDELPDSVKGAEPAALPKIRPKPLPATLPATLAPQLATLVDGPPRDPGDWVYEIKFDGYRLLARVDGADVKLFTRNGNDWTSKMAHLRASIEKAKLPQGWYDGEIVIVNEDGMQDFGALQGAFDSDRTQDIVYFLFDVPFFDGRDLRDVPLEARREILRAALQVRESDTLRFSANFDAPAQTVVQAACERGLEGVMAKRKDSAYRSHRSPDWIKLKCAQRQEFLICGWTDPQGARSGFGSLLLGVHDADGKIVYAGNVGTGFNERTLAKLKAQLDTIGSDKMPFPEKPSVPGRPHWVKPVLIAEVSFAQWTRDGRLRHAVFHGLRADKDPKSIVREEAASAPKAKAVAKSGAPTGSQPPATVAPPDRSPAGPVSHALSSRSRVTNPDRIIDKTTGVTKIELHRYYGLVGQLMMEHLDKRPVALVRAPAGVEGHHFFQKHAEVEKLPGIVQLDTALSPDHAAMLQIATAQGLLSAAQWNVIEIHTFNAVSTAFDTPDRIIFDLDPGEGVTWRDIQKAAQVMREFLDQLALSSFLKTSGGKGLHVVVPIKKLHTWDEAKGFPQAVVVHLATSLPRMFVAKSGPRNRIGKIFIDYLRNGLGATTVCAWSARARPGLGISVPVDWSELGALRGGDHWSVRDAHARLDKGNEPWKGYAAAARSLKPAMKTLGHV